MDLTTKRRLEFLRELLEAEAGRELTLQIKRNKAVIGTPLIKIGPVQLWKDRIVIPLSEIS